MLCFLISILVTLLIPFLLKIEMNFVKTLSKTKLITYFQYFSNFNFEVSIRMLPFLVSICIKFVSKASLAENKIFKKKQIKFSSWNLSLTWQNNLLKNNNNNNKFKCLLWKALSPRMSSLLELWGTNSEPLNLSLIWKNTVTLWFLK